jgi:hypothetical protein
VTKAAVRCGWIDEGPTTPKREIPAELAALFEPLMNQLCDIWQVLQDWQVLFDESEETVRLLNNTASHFFVMLRRTYIDSAILVLAKLGDRARKKGNTNLVLEEYIEIVSRHDSLLG